MRINISTTLNPIAWTPAIYIQLYPCQLSGRLGQMIYFGLSQSPALAAFCSSSDLRVCLHVSYVFNSLPRILLVSDNRNEPDLTLYLFRPSPAVVNPTTTTLLMHVGSSCQHLEIHVSCMCTSESGILPRVFTGLKSRDRKTLSSFQQMLQESNPAKDIPHRPRHSP
jgi:hypothetical protein